MRQLDDYQPLTSLLCLVKLPKTGGQSHFFLNKAQPDDIKLKAKSNINTGFETFFIRRVKDKQLVSSQ